MRSGNHRIKCSSFLVLPPAEDCSPLSPLAFGECLRYSFSVSGRRVKREWCRDAVPNEVIEIRAEKRIPSSTGVYAVVTTGIHKQRGERVKCSKVLLLLRRGESRDARERGQSAGRDCGEEAAVHKPSLSGRPFLTYQPLLQPGAGQQPTAGERRRVTEPPALRHTAESSPQQRVLFFLVPAEDCFLPVRTRQVPASP
ncbi:hypothetical protein MRX96_022724 [Rhipicephalus microplus]